ncbi:NAD(P)H-binding protein [Streptomyces sp. SID3343]|uniref:SDR family oxidoreductase n=1 Tax=Streptomyces sp. SID3343 TaxID=2690260 RepID=UPI001370905F|nr:NAD(P)H-binding protein [Streptomyces sp. SID3343]MYV99515.1 NAD(P)H-binding protein [Streptomyces sp. SID3343]
MPVVVTGAEQPLGRAVVLELAATGGEVRATVRTRAAVGALRAAGIRVAVTDLSDPLRLGAVLEGAHTVLHLDRGPDGRGFPADTWQWLLEAAQDTDLQRIVTVLPLRSGRTVVRGCELIVCQLPEQAHDRPERADRELVRELIEADRRADPGTSNAHPCGHGSEVVGDCRERWGPSDHLPIA